ncbi:MAG: hypothetical protein IJW92_01430 [Clostridia bacterium]|nr:hypothetical protein [Clostridia bacterium]
MNRGYFSRRRRGRIGIFALIIVLTALLLVSCVAGSNVLWVRGVLGLDARDYAAEPAERTLPHDGTVANGLCQMVSMVTGNSVALQSFQGTAQAVAHYRDQILNWMLCENYALYTGNSASIAAVEEAYPNTVSPTLIPAEDFENTVYRYFGGTSVDHNSGNAFAYLERAGFYSMSAQAYQGNVEIQILELEETLHTYRMTFRLFDGENRSEVYTAIFVKRDDGSCYWKALNT